MNREVLQPIAKAMRENPMTASINPAAFRRFAVKGTPKPDGTVAKLKLVKIGKRLFVSHAEIDRFISELNDEKEAPRA